MALLTAVAAGPGEPAVGFAQRDGRVFVVEDPPRTPAEQQRMFHLPEGFQIELVAAEPDIINPINMNFDAAGCLYVSQSIEYPIPAPEGQPARDTIRRIVDSDGDGVPDDVSIFAAGLNIPIGVAPVSGGVLGFSIPNLLFFEDVDGDSKCDGRQTRFGEFGFDDTHGMVSSLTWWIDGWLYGCHGFVNTSEVAGADGERITMISGNTYRLQADGSRIEHYAHGQVNPFGLTFDPWGNVFTADCHTRPATMLLRGAHYPRSPGDGLGLGPELMQHSHGSTGIAGIVYYAADHFPEEYHGALLIGNPITGRINYDRLERHGSTYTAIEQDDFLTCDDPWFRPVDLQLGPDGALYIADMYNCIIGHYEVPLLHPKRDREHGRIWRVTYVGTNGAKQNGSQRVGSEKSSQPSDLTQCTTDELLAVLAEPNLVRRTHATHQLVERIGAAAIVPTRALLSGDDATDSQRAHALWVLHRLGAMTTMDWRPRLDDTSALVRVHAVRVLAESETWDATIRESILQRLKDPDGFVQRAAVEALGRHPHEVSVHSLLELIVHTDPMDRCLIHAARMALRDTLRASDRLPQWEQQFADSPDDLRILADVAVGIPSSSAAEFLWRQFDRDECPVPRQSAVLRHVIRNIDANQLEHVLARVATYSDRDRQTQIAVASAVHQGAQERGVAIPKEIRSWGARLVRPLLTSEDVERVRQGIELTEQMRLSEMHAELARLCAIDTPFPAQRIAAIQTLLAVNPEEIAALFFAIVNDERDVPALRQFAAEKLGNRKEPASREIILRMLPTASQTIAVGLARGLVIDREGAKALLNMIEQGKVPRQVLQDRKVQRLLPFSGLADAESRMKALIADLPSVDQKIQQTIEVQRTAFRKAEPDLAHGAEIFRKACAVCHQLENLGEKVGPELDGVGQRGLDRLLEDVLDPNRTVDKNYRATIVLTDAGQVYTGLVIGQEGQVLVLADQTGKKVRIPIEEIDEQRLIEGSAMPANVDEILSASDLHDLMAFLLTKAAKPPANSQVSQ